MKYSKLLTLFFLLPFYGIAQNCVYPFSANCWFTANGFVRISPDNSKFYVIGGNGPTGNTNSASCSPTSTTLKVYDMTPAGIVYNTAMSQGLSGQSSYFTQNNGFFYASGSNVSFRSSTGTNTLVANGIGGVYFNKVVGAPNKMIGRVQGQNKVYIFDATNPAVPTYTLINLPGPTTNIETQGIYTSITFGASETDDRIYYAVTENETFNVQPPFYKYKIKASTFAGTTPAGWTDVIVHRGCPVNFAISPKDGTVLARLNRTEYHLDFHTVVAFDKNGTLATDMNISDLSNMGGPNFGTSELIFDAEGNIYANRWIHGNPAESSNSLGLMKFDPKGNLDMGFMRNAWGSYDQAVGVAALSFDVSSTGMIIKTSHQTAVSFNDGYALDINHNATNGEDPTVAIYSSLATAIASWGAYPVFQTYPLSNYQQVQFLFNNGKLVRPNMSQTDIDANCGIANPKIAPNTTAAVGTINCSGVAFLNAPVQGTPSTVVIKVPINVTTAGTFSPITVTGSGMTLQDANASFTTTTTGMQDFYVTVKYDGTTLGPFTITVTGAGACAADLSDQTKRNPSIIDIWTPQNCTFVMVGPKVK